MKHCSLLINTETISMKTMNNKHRIDCAVCIVISLNSKKYINVKFNCT